MDPSPESGPPGANRSGINRPGVARWMSDVERANTRSVNTGWFIGLLACVAVVAVGAVFWFSYHP